MSDKRTRSTFTIKQKLAILVEASEQMLQYGMTKQQLKGIRELEAQNLKLKELLGQKEL
jgi:hypothetical protein